MKALSAPFFALTLLSGAAVADTYNAYIVEQSSKIDSSTASVQDLFGNERLEALAAAGDIRAQYELGMTKYSVGDNSGVEWLEKAAAQGHVRAQYIVGGIYIEGKARGRDLKKAFSLMDDCSKHGNPDCSFYLGTFYEEGLGVVQPNADVAKWYMVEAANFGVKRAIERLCKGVQNCKYTSK